MGAELSDFLESVSFKRIKVFTAQIPVFWFHYSLSTFNSISNPLDDFFLKVLCRSLFFSSFFLIGM